MYELEYETPAVEIPCSRRSGALISVLFSFLVGTAGTSAQAAPIIFGDIEDIVSVDASDCPSCTSQELDVLQRGVGMMLGEMRRVAVDDSDTSGPVCTVQASHARDLALITFEAYRAGAISESRWRDSLRAKARIAGSLTDETIEAMLRDFRSRLEERYGIPIEPGSLLELQVDIFASRQYARLFDYLARGTWDGLASNLRQSVVGPNPVVEAVVNQQWQNRGAWNRLLVHGRPYALWKENELALVSELKDDFLVGTIPEARDILYEDYYFAMSDEPWGVMGFGCGLAAAAGFRRYARELSEGFQVIAVPGGGGEPEPWIVVDAWPGTGSHPVPPPIIDVYPVPIPEKYSVVPVPDPWPSLVIERRGRRANDDGRLRGPRGGGGGGLPPSGGSEAGMPTPPEVPYPGPDGPDEGPIPWGWIGATPEDSRRAALERFCGAECPGGVAGIRMPEIRNWGSADGELGAGEPTPTCVCQP